MIWKDGNTPYNKSKTSDKASAATLLLSDASLNDDIANYITSMVRTQTVLEIIKNIVKTPNVDEAVAVSMINAMLGD